MPHNTHISGNSGQAKGLVITVAYAVALAKHWGLEAVELLDEDGIQLVIWPVPDDL